MCLAPHSFTLLIREYSFSSFPSSLLGLLYIQPIMSFALPFALHIRGVLLYLPNNSSTGPIHAKLIEIYCVYTVVIYPHHLARVSNEAREIRHTKWRLCQHHAEMEHMSMKMSSLDLHKNSRAMKRKSVIVHSINYANGLKTDLKSQLGPTVWNLLGSRLL